MTSMTLTKVAFPNTDIDISYTSSDVYMRLSMTAGLKSWSDLTGVLNSILGDKLTKKIMVRIVSQMGTVIAMDNRGSSSMRLPIEGHDGAYIDIDVSKVAVNISAHGFQVKPMT